jgi:hypothetical protein
MKKVLLSFSLLLCLFLVVGLQSCKNSDGQKLKYQIELTVNGKAHTYAVKSATYDPITRNAELIFGDQQVIIEMSFVNLAGALSLTTGSYNASDICQAVIAVSGAIDGNAVISTSEGSNASITLSSVSADGKNANISGTTNDFSMESFGGGAPVEIKGLKFSAHVEDTSSSKDFISFKQGNNQMTFYTESQSHYTDDGDLRLSANILADPYAFGAPGVLIMLRGVAYPPVTQTISTYQSGLELYYNFWDGEKSQCGDYYEYSSGNNSVDVSDNTTLTITSVDATSDGYILKGTFSGNISTYDEVSTPLTSGSFKVKIPKQ